MKRAALSCALSSCLLGCSAQQPTRTLAQATPRPAKAWHPKEGTPKLDCPLGDAVDPSAPDEILARCEAGKTSSCLGLLEHGKLGETRLAMVREQLRLACEENPTCGCAAYGEALFVDGTAATIAEAMEVLRRACLLGTVPACDAIDLSLEICMRDPRERGCEPLFEGGALRRPQATRFAQVELPPALSGCFLVDGPVVDFPVVVSPPLPSPSTSEMPSLSAGAFISLFGNDGSLCQIDPGACGPAFPTHAEASRGDAYCFDFDRISYRPAKGDWDQVLTAWLAELDHPVEYHSAQGLRLEARRDLVTLRDHHESTGLLLLRAKLTPPPTLESVCTPARACVLALQKAKLPTEVLRGVDLSRLHSCSLVRPYVRKNVASPPQECL